MNYVAQCMHCKKLYERNAFLDLAWPSGCRRAGTDEQDAGAGYVLIMRDCSCKPGATFSILVRADGSIVGLRENE